MSTHISENNPKKETMYALGGLALFLSIVLLIGISAFLRPAGEHIEAEPAADEAVAETTGADDTLAVTEEVSTTPADDTLAVTEEVSTTPADAAATPAATETTDTATATADTATVEAPAAEAPVVEETAAADTASDAETAPATAQ